jgi:hypothetical protein
MDRQTLRREARALLRALGPMSPEELGRQLLTNREPGTGDEAIGDPVRLRTVLLENEDDPEPTDPERGDAAEPTDPERGDADAVAGKGEGFLAFPLADGRLCDLEDLLEGLTLTHELTDDERQTQRLSIDLDLAPLTMMSDDGQTYPLADGEMATSSASDSWQLTGPPGWLPDAPVVVARVLDGRIELTGRDELPPVDEAVVDRLEQALGAARTHQDLVDEIDLIIEARARFPRLLTSPHAPLSELLDVAGLRSGVHDGLLYEDEPDGWEDEAELDELITHLYDDHDFDDADVELILEVMADVQRLSNHVLRASLDRVGAADRVAATDTDGPLDFDALDRAQLAEMTLDALEAIDLEAAGEQLGFVLADIGLTAAVVEDVVGSEALAGAGLLAVLEASRPSRSGRTARANDAWVRGRVMELVADDHAEAELQLRRAHDLDEGHLYAALDVAGYLSDRGQAGAALGLLRHLDLPHLAGLEQMLAGYAKPGPTSAGRNQPCPCGSGRKHKVCCQARNGWPLQDRLPWVWEKINSFAASPRAAGLAEPLEFAADAPGRPGADDRDVAVANLTLFEGGVLQELCDIRGSLLPADELELLRAWAQVRGRVYELVDQGAGDRLTFLDVTSGDRVTFVDHSMAAADLPAGTAVLAWLVPEPEGLVPSIGGVVVPDGRREELLELLDDHPSAFELAAWYRSLQAPPRLRTTAGDPLVMTTLVYAVPDTPAAREALADHLEDDGDTLTVHEESRDGQQWVKGSITVEDGTLTVSTNSAPRAAWFEALIAEVVPDAELVDVERIPAEDVAAGLVPGSGADPDADSDGDGDGLLDGDALDALDPEVRRGLEAEMDAMMRRHEDAWIDTPLPVLHGATPRDAVGDPTRRDELLRVLADIERHAAGWSSPGRPMDAERLRQLLGL